MTIEIELLVVAALALGIVGVGIGYWWASANHKRAAGGKSVQELAKEKELYQEQVEEHFKETAELLNEMTDKYRDVYRHMAQGAQQLTSAENVAPALAALKNGLLAAPQAASSDDSIVASAESQAVESESANIVEAVEDAEELTTDEAPVHDHADEPQDETPEIVETPAELNANAPETADKNEFFSAKDSQAPASTEPSADSEPPASSERES